MSPVGLARCSATPLMKPRTSASTSPSRRRKRPRSTVENTSRFSNTPSIHCADRTAASSLGKLMKFSRRRGYRQAIGDPAIEIRQCAGADRLLLGNGPVVAAQPYPIDIFGRRVGERRKQSEIDVHRLE